MSRREKWTAALALALFSIVFYSAAIDNYYLLQLDTAMFLESIETTRERGVPSTVLTNSVIYALDHVIRVPAEAVCKAPFERDRGEYLPIHSRHLQPILYPLAGLNFVLPAVTLFGLCAVIAFPGVLAAVYLLAREWAVPVFGAAILVALVAAHPAWSYASFGQFYADKLFPPFAIVYLFMLHDWIANGKERPAWLLVSGALAISTTERSAIMLAAGSFGVMMLFGFRRRWGRRDLLPVAFTVGMVMYVALYMKLLQSNPDYASFSQSALDAIRAILRNPEALPPFLKFLMINLLFIAPFAIFARRWTLIALGSMIPNLAGSIGGAEKLGWTTHYHSTYFPFLIMVLIAGAAGIARRRPQLQLAVSGGAAAVALFLFFLNPFSAKPLLDFPAMIPPDTAAVKMIALNTGAWHGVHLRAATEHVRTVASRVPAGAEAVTTEAYMPALYANGVRLMHLYPMGLRAAEYAVVPYTGTAGALQYHGHVSYLGPQVAEAADRCLADILLQHYSVVDRIPQTPYQGTDIFRLKSKMPAATRR